MTNFGEIILQKRKEKCMTQGKLAKSLGLVQATISAWEIGRQILDRGNPIISTLSKILDIDEPILNSALEEDREYMQQLYYNKNINYYLVEQKIINGFEHIPEIWLINPFYIKSKGGYNNLNLDNNIKAGINYNILLVFDSFEDNFIFGELAQQFAIIARDVKSSNTSLKNKVMTYAVNFINPDEERIRKYNELYSCLHQEVNSACPIFDSFPLIRNNDQNSYLFNKIISRFLKHPEFFKNLNVYYPTYIFDSPKASIGVDCLETRIKKKELDWFTLSYDKSYEAIELINLFKELKDLNV